MTKEQKYRSVMQQGYEKLLNEDKAGAALKFKEALHLSSKPMQALYDLAPLAEATGRWDDAERWYGQFLKYVPRNVVALNSLGRIKCGKGKFTEGGRLLKQSTEIDPTWALPVFNLANLYTTTRQFPAAERLYRKTMRLSPRWSMPYLYLAGVKGRQGKLNEAEVLYQKSIDLAPRSTYELYYYATFNQHILRRLKVAERLYRRSILIEPRVGRHYANLAGCLLDQGKRQEALSMAQKAKSLGFMTPNSVYKRLQLK